MAGPVSPLRDILRDWTRTVTEVYQSQRSYLETGEAGDRRREAPIEVAMETGPAVIQMAPKNSGKTIVEPIRGKREWNAEKEERCPGDLLAPSAWRSRIYRMVRLQAQKLLQLHRTVGHCTNVLEALAPREEAQWLGMLTKMQEREQKWDTRHEDDKLWGAGSTIPITMVMKRVAPGQEARENTRDRAAKMDFAVLEASQHADTTQEGEPEMCQQLKQQLKLTLLLQLQSKPQHEPKPMFAPAPARRWEIVPPLAQ